MWNKFKNLDYKIKLRVFYSISVILIIYFIYDIVQISNTLTLNQMYLETKLYNFGGSTLSYDYNLTIGGVIRGVAFDLIQIIFIVAFMITLYIHEVNNGSK